MSNDYNELTFFNFRRFKLLGLFECNGIENAFG
jgi:hypothetical protein